MDINDLRSLFTVLTFMSFLAIVFWAWSGHRKKDFDEAARMVLDDDASLSGNRFNQD
ncbi:MAG: CcoQ/FixQ family Cbb3-type cytochrome c oxidase assembly chaperone [Georgfuchsia sp.]